MLRPIVLVVLFSVFLFGLPIAAYSQVGSIQNQPSVQPQTPQVPQLSCSAPQVTTQTASAIPGLGLDCNNLNDISGVPNYICADPIT